MNENAVKNRDTMGIFLGWGVVAIALALRLLHAFYTQRFNPLAADLQLDAATYDTWARSLAFGGDPGPTTLMQAPVYPWLVSLIYRIFGPSLAAVRVMQAVLGTATCGLIMLCTRRFFKSLAAAILAGLFTALYAPLIFYEGVILPATLIVFLNTLFVAIMYAERRPGTARLLASGIVLGVAVAANPPTLVMAPFVLLHLLFCTPKEGTSRSFSSFIRTAAVLTAGFAVALAPIAARNAIRTGEFIPLTAGGGINFYIGNNARANGFYAAPSYRGQSLGGTPEAQAKIMQEIASRETGRRLSRMKVSRFWLDAGLDYVRGNPGAWSSLLWLKFRFFWNGYERSNVENFYFHRRFPGVLALPLLTFGLVAPLGLVGIFLTRRRWKGLWLFYGGILTYLFTALVFYVLARYRLPALPFLLSFAGAAIAELISLARSRRIAEPAISLAALGLIALFSNTTIARDTPAGTASQFVRLGNASRARGDTTGAERAYRDALKLDPENARARRELLRIRERRS